MENDNSCPIWETPASVWKDRRDGIYADSPRAGGRYFISRTAQVNVRRADDVVKARLTTWLVDQHSLGVECPEIMTTNIDEAERRQPLPVYERADRLLGFLCMLSRFVGDELSIVRPRDFLNFLAVSESVDEKEVKFLFEVLIKREFIVQEMASVYERRGITVIGVENKESEKEEYVDRRLTITADGHIHLAELETKTIDSRQAFVAMWFDESMMETYEKGIAPGIEDAGYQPIRIDRKDHNNRIDDEIIAEIRRSRFLVADFTQGETGARGGVYYEAGFAHGLKMPVVFTCRADVIDRIHFDTRQYNHISWTTPEQLRDRLAQRIAATIGDGPLKKNSYV